MKKPPKLGALEVVVVPKVGAAELAPKPNPAIHQQSRASNTLRYIHYEYTSLITSEAKLNATSTTLLNERCNLKL
jgi:hypothetical protein